MLSQMKAISGPRVAWVTSTSPVAEGVSALTSADHWPSDQGKNHPCVQCGIRQMADAEEAVLSYNGGMREMVYSAFQTGLSLLSLLRGKRKQCFLLSEERIRR
jgi:hypothetical protein